MAKIKNNSKFFLRFFALLRTRIPTKKKSVRRKDGVPTNYKSDSYMLY